MQYSEQSINEAKDRVREMQSRARQYTEGEAAPSVPAEVKRAAPAHTQRESADGSTMLILAVLLLLWQEEADNMLLLALMYLLF